MLTPVGQHKQLFARIALSLVGMVLNCDAIPCCRAEDKREVDAIRKLTQLISVEDETQWENASSLYASLNKNSKLYPIATQALTLIRIRQGKYEDALKCLETVPAPSYEMSAPLALERARLQLWLLLETAPKQSESQYQHVVRQVLASKQSQRDLTEACEFLGKMNGMLESKGNGSDVPAATLQKGFSLLQKLESKPAVAKLDEGHKAASHWAVELDAQIKMFESMDLKRAVEQHRTIQLEWKRSEDDLSAHEGKLKQEVSEKEQLKQTSKELFFHRKGILYQLTLEAPNKPPYPKEPSPPHRPQTEYEYDRKTGERKVKREPTRKEWDEYDKEKASFSLRLDAYRIALQTYPTRLAAWQQLDFQRRAGLQADLERANQDINTNKVAIEKKQNAIAADVLDQVREKRVEAKRAELTAKISSVAIAHVQSRSKTHDSSARPSNFPLFNFDWESNLLQESIQKVVAREKAE